MRFVSKGSVVTTGASLAGVVLGSIIALSARPAFAENSIVVESKTVVAGAKNVEVGIYLSNTAPIGAVHLPFEIREITAGAFIKDTLILVPQNRLIGTLISTNSAQYFARPTDTLGYEGCWWVRSRPDFVSPDMAHYFAASGLFTPARCLPSGTDGAPPLGDMITPGSVPSLVLRFDVTDTPGTFQIVKSCVGTEQMIYAACFGAQNVFEPDFVPGTITIVACECECHGDPECDGKWSMSDVVRIAQEAFGQSSAAHDVDCGRGTRSDLDCNCTVDIVDVIRMIDTAFRGKDPGQSICNGCSDNCP